MNYTESVRAARSLASDLGVEDEEDVETLADDELFAAYALMQEQGDIYANQVESTMAGDLMKEAARGVESGAMTVATIRAEELLGRSLAADLAADPDLDALDELLSNGADDPDWAVDHGGTSLDSFEVEIVDAVDDVEDVRDLIAVRTTVVEFGRRRALLRDVDGNVFGEVECFEVAQRDDGTVVARLPDVDDPTEHVLGTVDGLVDGAEVIES